MNVSVKHHLIFGFFISFSPCNIMEIYQIECPVWKEPSVRNMSFSLFFLGWFFCLLFYRQGQCDFVSEMRKHGDCFFFEQIQSVDGKREEPMPCPSPLARRSRKNLLFTPRVVHNSSPKLVKMERDFPFHQKFLMALWLWAVLFFDSA